MNFKVTTLDKFAMIEGGYAYKSADFLSSSKWPVLKIKNIQTSRVNYSDVSFISDALAESTRKWKTQTGDVLISMTGSGPSAPASLVGRVAKVRRGDPTAFINQRVGRLIVKSDLKICQSFLYYVLSLSETQQFLVANATGSANQVNISAKTIGSVPCPDVDFQTSRRVSSFLDSLDDRIVLLRETNKILESIAQAIFKSWFVDFDPVHAKAKGTAPEWMDEATAALFPDSFEETELGMVPKGWKKGSIGDILTLRNDRIKASAVTESLHYVPIESIDSKNPFLTGFKSGKEAQSSLILFKKGDILFGAMRPYFHKVCIAPFNGVTRTTVFTLTPRDNRISAFSLFQIFQEETVSYATQHSEGSTIPFAKWNNSLEHMPILMPEIKLQISFSEIIGSMIERANHNSALALSLSVLRDTLLPRLISGQLRIEDAQEMAESV